MTSDLAVLLLRLGVVAILYLFLLALAVVIQRELRAESRSHAAVRPRGELTILDPGTSHQPVGRAFPLSPTMRLGRARDCAVLLDDEFVSATHAAVLLRDERWWLRDGGSTNGTYLNGAPVEREQPLHDGDEIRIGGVVLRVGL